MATVVPQVDFNRNAVSPVECVKGGWNLIKNQYWLILGMVIVGWMIASAVPFGILMGPMMCGLFLTFFKLRRGEPIEFGLLFKGFEYLGQSIIATLIHVVPMICLVVGAYILFYVFFLFAMFSAQASGDQGAAALLIVFLVYALFFVAVMALIMFLSIGFMFVYPLIVDRGLPGLDAVKMSFKAAFANFWGLLGMVFLNFLLSVAGIFLCFIGVYFVLPISYAAVAVAYEQIFGLRQAPMAPSTPPPPPVFT